MRLGYEERLGLRCEIDRVRRVRAGLTRRTPADVERVVLAHLNGGTTVPELVNRTGAGTHAVRAALVRLCAQGLAVYGGRPRHGELGVWAAPPEAHGDDLGTVVAAVQAGLRDR